MAVEVQGVTDDESEVIGTRKKKHKVGATRKASTPISTTSNFDKQLLGQVVKMTEDIASISRSLFEGESQSEGVSREEMRQTVQEEVQ